MGAACRARPHPPPSLIAVSRGRSRAGLMPLAKVPPTLPPKPPRASLPEGAEGSSKFLGVPPERRLATSKVPWWRSRRHGRGRKASSQHFLLWLIRREGGVDRKQEEENLLPHLPCFRTTSCSLRAERGPASSWSRAPGECVLSGRTLTSVSARGAARSASSELRAAVPGPGRRRAGCIAAAAASGQHPGALHA